MIKIITPKTFTMKHICSLLFFLIFIFTGPVATHAKPPTDNNEPASKSIIIRFKNQFDAPAYSGKNLSGYSAATRRTMLVSTLKNFSLQSQDKLLNALKADNQLHQLNNIKQYWLANIITCETTDEMIEQLKKREEIESISLNVEEKLVDINKPANQALSGSPTAYNIEMVRALEANSYGYTGNGVIVAILDTGVNSEHEDLKDALWSSPEFSNHGWNFTLDNDDTSDGMGHGTHCAGTILGSGKSGTRTGVAPDARLMILKVLDRNGYGTQSFVWDAIQFAIENGANVLSLSLGFTKPSDADKKTWRDAMTNLLSFNILAVIAAGNEGHLASYYKVPDNVRTPGTCPAAWLHPQQTVRAGTSSVITVGSLKQSGLERAASSSIGPTAWGGIETYDDYTYNPGMGLTKPDIANPGEKILSLDWKNTKGYTEMSGTSMATPCVAGIVAAMLSKNSDLTPAEIVRILSESAVKISPTFNNQTGAGRADALLATLYTPNIGMNCTAATLKKTTGYISEYLNPGDEGNLSFSFTNESSEDIDNYQIEITSLTAQGIITVNTVNLPAIKAKATTEITNACIIKILPEARINELIDISVVIRKGDKVWSNLFRFPLCKAELSSGNLQTKEVTGNGNSIIEAGETAELICPVISTGTEPCRKVKVSFLSNSPYLTFPQTEEISFDEISGTENIKIQCGINKETPKWYSADLTLKLTGENVDTTFAYKVTIGKQAILIVDRTKDRISAQAVKSYLEKQNYSFTVTNILSQDPDSLQLSHSIWFFAGVYPKANPVSKDESRLLKNYLQAGGNLYMEGGDLWYYDKATMNASFNIEPLGHNGGTLTKIAGCIIGFNDTYEKDYSSTNQSIDNISPIDPAFSMYKNTNPEFITTVAYNQGSYRTIGSSSELGGILSDSGENFIMDSYLDFFQIKDGYFTSGIKKDEQIEKLYIKGFCSENEYIAEISVPSPAPTIISLYGPDGQLLRQIRENITEKSTIRIPISRKGIHLVTVNAGGETYTKKVLF